MEQPHEKGRYTYADYVTWDEQFRCEVINGEIISMSPSPTPKHQRIQRELMINFSNGLKEKTCEVLSSPIDVCLFAEKEESNDNIINWVQPDLLVICDKNKISDKNIVGAPDLVIEILSPATARNDRVVKFNSYQKAGVREYGIVDPIHESVEVYVLDHGLFKQNGVYFKGDQILVVPLENFSIELNDVFK